MSGYRTRVVPILEWGVLETTPLAPVLGTLPGTTQILAVEHEDCVVGTWAVVPYVHAEGLWIDPAHRDKGVGRRLLKRMPAIADALGANGAVMTAASDPKVAAYLERLGAIVLPGTPYVLPLRKVR